MVKLQVCLPYVDIIYTVNLKYLHIIINRLIELQMSESCIIVVRDVTIVNPVHEYKNYLLVMIISDIY